MTQESKQVRVWLNKNIEGNYFVYGSYFFTEKEGDVPASRPYNQNEIKFKEETDSLENIPLNKLKSKVNQIARKYKFKATIKAE